MTEPHRSPDPSPTGLSGHRTNDKRRVIARLPLVIARLPLVGRIGWGFADQSLSSLTNFAVGIAVARSVSIEEFGAFALVFASYSVVLGVSRALATEPLVVRHSKPDSPPSGDAERRALGSSLAVGLVASAGLLTLAHMSQGEIRGMLGALAVVMPGLMVQDAWRVVFFVRGHGQGAFLNDLTWAVALPLPLLVAAQHPSAASMTLAWGSAGCFAAFVGLVQTKRLPRPGQAVSWLRANWDLSSRYLAESVLLTGTQQAYYFTIGAVAGLSAVGEVRLVLVVLGPVNVLIQGVGMAALPEVVRAAHTAPRRLRRVVFAVSGVVSSGALLWGMVVLTAPSALDWLAGSSWSSASQLVPPMILMQMVNGLNTGAFMGLRAMQQVNTGLAIRALSSVSFLAGATVGAMLGGGQGAAWGLAVAASANFLMWWLGFVHGQRLWWRGAEAQDG